MKRAGISIEPCERKTVPTKARDSLLERRWVRFQRGRAGFAVSHSLRDCCCADTAAGFAARDCCCADIDRRRIRSLLEIVLPTRAQDSPADVVVLT